MSWKVFNRSVGIALAGIGVVWLVLFLTGLQQRTAGGFMIQLDLFVAGVALFLVWLFANLIRTEVLWKRRNAATRPADPNAGATIAQLKQATGGRLVARSDPRGTFLKSPTREVELDTKTRKIVFRGFTFTRNFIGNRPTPEVTLDFQDLLAGRTYFNHGRQSLFLRTTAGRVVIADSVKPFPVLADVLFDAIEVNRSQPERYAAALAREAKVKVPWWGWLLLLLGLAGVAAFAIFLWYVLGG